jgi:hypothetical protein
MKHTEGFLKLVNEARTRVQEVTVTETLQRLSARNDPARLIDVREDAAIIGALKLSGYSLRAARDALVARQWEFHNTILGTKDQVMAQFGPNSDEVQAVKLKKKSEYKAPKRKKTGEK